MMNEDNVTISVHCPVIVLFIPNIRELCKNNVICRLLVVLYGLLGFSYIIILLVYYFHIQKIKTNIRIKHRIK